MVSKNIHTGSSFDSFLEEEGILEEVEAAAIKHVVAWQQAQERKTMSEKQFQFVIGEVVKLSHGRASTPGTHVIVGEVTNIDPNDSNWAWIKPLDSDLTIAVRSEWCELFSRDPFSKWPPEKLFRLGYEAGQRSEIERRRASKSVV